MTALMLDTCALIWLGFGSEDLSSATRSLIENTQYVYVSPISCWEIARKCGLGKLKLPLPPREWVEAVITKYRLLSLPLTQNIMFKAAELSPIHKDPADRFIIATALLNCLPVVTGDRNFPLYGVTVYR